MRTLGMEEELLVVDVATGLPLPLADRVRDRAGRGWLPGQAEDDGPGGRLAAEFQRQQLEVDTTPHIDLGALEQEVRAWRAAVAKAAREEGARIIASGTSPMAVRPEPVRSERFDRIVERFGFTTTEHLCCGCHIHVSVASDEEAVAVLDRIRVWLPALLALSANSPFWQGQDSRYASFRAQAMIRWPSVGPTDVFGSADAYHDRVRRMVATGVVLDEAMVYFDARLSSSYPTVEVRAADVCMRADDAVLLAALSRALVDTAAAEWSDGRPAPDVPTQLLRLATWQASREGVDGNLLDPLEGRPRPATEVVDALLRHVAPALDANGDLALARERLASVLGRGNGARRQRDVLRRTGRLADVVADLARATMGAE